MIAMDGFNDRNCAIICYSFYKRIELDKQKPSDAISIGEKKTDSRNVVRIEYTSMAFTSKYLLMFLTNKIKKFHGNPFRNKNAKRSLLFIVRSHHFFVFVFFFVFLFYSFANS